MNEETYGQVPKMKGMNMENPQSGQVDNPTNPEKSKTGQQGAKEHERNKGHQPFFVEWILQFSDLKSAWYDNVYFTNLS